MSYTRIVKVKTLQGTAKILAERRGLYPEDLVVLTISIEKIVGDPISFLLSNVQSSGGTQQ